MKKLIVGNWKMNGLASSLAEIEALKGAGGTTCDIVVCPPLALTERAAKIAAGSSVSIGAQDCHAEAAGAYTGDVSAAMLFDAGARYVIVGHSERRSAYRENDTLIAKKASAGHLAGLTSIICVGESRSERDGGKALVVVAEQLRGSVPPGTSGLNTAIAYEPVWAIGTGLVPTMEQIAEVHSSIRHILQELLGEAGRSVRILYGGSVKSSNAGSIFAVKDLDGALVGGASLSASDFAGIIAAAA